MLRRRFPRMVHLGDHHTAHAYSAYMTSGFEEATAITTDGFGDGSSGKVFRCTAGRCQELYGGSAVNSVGIFHAEIAQILEARNMKLPGRAPLFEIAHHYHEAAALGCRDQALD